MASDPLTGSPVRTPETSRPSARCLELGCGTGRSTAWILEDMDQSSFLITVDNNESLIGILRYHPGSDSPQEIGHADGDSYLQSLEVEHHDFPICRSMDRKVPLP